MSKKILEVTQKIIIKTCKEEKQPDFQNALIAYIEFLDEDRSQEEKLNFADRLVDSYNKEEVSPQKDLIDGD